MTKKEERSDQIEKMRSKLFGINTDIYYGHASRAVTKLETLAEMAEDLAINIRSGV